MPRIAVITGDLVGSTKVADPQSYLDHLKALLALMGQRFAARCSVFRGDGFQLALPESVNAIEVAVLLRTGLLAKSPDAVDRWDARLAIAFGEGELDGDESSSPVFVDSGRTLDALDKDRLSIAGHSELFLLATGLPTRFADELLGQLTSVEAEVLYLFLLEHGTHQSIADRLGKKRPTVTEALNRASYALIDRYVEDMDSLVRQLPVN